MGVRKLVNVHHRAGYPKNSVKENNTHDINKFIMGEHNYVKTAFMALLGTVLGTNATFIESSIPIEILYGY